jgi:hypothetical protein
MAKLYLTPRGPQGFEKFSPSSSSDKAYIRLKSKVHNKPFVHAPFHTSTKHIPNKLAIRTKSLKMPSTSSPKRVRRGSNAEERPTKHSRRLSDSGMTYLFPPYCLGTLSDLLFPDVSASSSRESTEGTLFELCLLRQLFSYSILRDTVLTYLFQQSPALKALAFSIIFPPNAALPLSLRPTGRNTCAEPKLTPSHGVDSASVIW